MKLETFPEQKIVIEKRRYTVIIHRKVVEPIDAPRLLVVTRQLNELSQKFLWICIQAIKRYTPEAHELWVIDNNSPIENTEWLLECQGINIVLNRTEPIPPEDR